MTHYAAGFGQEEILAILLENDPQGQSLRIRNNAGLTPLGMAQNYHHDAISALFEKKYKVLSLSFESSLLQRVQF